MGVSHHKSITIADEANTLLQSGLVGCKYDKRDIVIVHHEELKNKSWRLTNWRHF